MFIEKFSTVIRLLSDSLNLIGCRGNIKSEFSKKVCFSRKSRLKVTYMFMALTNKAVVGGTASPAMAGPLFWPKMVLARPLFWPIMIFFIFLPG